MHWDDNCWLWARVTHSPGLTETEIAAVPFGDTGSQD